MDPQLNSPSSTDVTASEQGSEQSSGQRATESPSKRLTPEEFARNKEEALRCAREQYEEGMDWVQFFREVLGVNGVVASLIPEGSLEAFKATEEYNQIQQLVARLRADAVPQTEPNKVVTVRMPESLHKSLQGEASRLRTSVNKLCISKLLQLIENHLVPSEDAEAKGRGGREKRGGETGRGRDRRGGGDSRRADV